MQIFTVFQPGTRAVLHERWRRLRLLVEDGEARVILETLNHLLELGLGELLVPVAALLEDLDLQNCEIILGILKRKCFRRRIFDAILQNLPPLMEFDEIALLFSKF